MRRLLDSLDDRTVTLTVYNFGGDDEGWRALSEWLGGHGVTLRSVNAEHGQPADVGIFHDGEELLDAVSTETLLDQVGVDGSEAGGPLSDLLADQSAATVKMNRSIEEMVRISREFERRAWRCGEGAIHAGFQLLSSVANSERTMEIYRKLAAAGVSVTVYGYPDSTFDDVPFTVVEDTGRELEAYWFLLYDGGGDPSRTAALVSEECTDGDGSVAERGGDATTAQLAMEAERTYDSYWTTDPATVDRLYALARDEHPSIIRPVWTPGSD